MICCVYIALETSVSIEKLMFCLETPWSIENSWDLTEISRELTHGVWGVYHGLSKVTSSTVCVEVRRTFYYRPSGWKSRISTLRKGEKRRDEVNLLKYFILWLKESPFVEKSLYTAIPSLRHLQGKSADDVIFLSAFDTNMYGTAILVERGLAHAQYPV